MDVEDLSPGDNIRQVGTFSSDEEDHFTYLSDDSFNDSSSEFATSRSPVVLVDAPAKIGVLAKLEQKEKKSLLFSEILQIQEGVVSEVVDVLNFENDTAFNLLLKYQWDKEKLLDSFCSSKLGSSRKPKILKTTPTKPSLFYCPFTLEETPSSEGITLHSDGVTHLCSKDFFRDFLVSKSEERSSCLLIKCPCGYCDVTVTRKIWYSLLGNVQKDSKICAARREKYSKALKRYERFLVESFVEKYHCLKWCPTRNCGSVFFSTIHSESIECKQCEKWYCFECLESSHAPVSCDLLRFWRKTASMENATNMWISQHTKKCPGCHQNIEKNEGCNHMSCRCGKQFCWLCLGDWNNHSGSYACNRVPVRSVDGSGAIQADLQRHTFCLERFELNDKQIKLARDRLEALLLVDEPQQLREEDILRQGAADVLDNAPEKPANEEKQDSISLYSFKSDSLHESFSDRSQISKIFNPEAEDDTVSEDSRENDFAVNNTLIQAQKQIIYNHIVLKHSYILSYFLPDGNIRNLFEMQQGDLEKYNIQLLSLLEGNMFEADMNEVSKYTKITSKFLKNFIKGVRTEDMNQIAFQRKGR